MAPEPDVAQALARTDLFGSLNRRALDRLASLCSVTHHPGGKVVASEGDSPGVGFHLILDGTASVTVHGKPRRTLSPGDYFGEMSLIDGLGRSATVLADTDLRTAALTTWQFRPLLHEEPDIAVALLRVLCARLRELEKVQ